MSLDFNNTQNAFAYKSNFELIRDYQIFRLINNNLLVRVGTTLASKLINIGLSKPVAIGMKPTVYATFCGGTSLDDATKKIKQLTKYNVHSILDYGVEGKEREDDFNRTAQAIKDAIKFAKNNSNIKFVCSKFTGLISFSILEKLHSQSTLDKNEQLQYNTFKERIWSIAQLAKDADISLFVDAEESWIQQPLDDITYELMLAFNQQQPTIYNTVQLYRKDRLQFLEKQLQKAKKDAIIYGVKIVRGAYMEKEAQRAKKLNYSNPIQASKMATDNDYNTALKLCIENYSTTAVCIATHNEESTLLATQLMKEYEIANNHSHIHFSQLLGMSDHISFNLAQANYNVHKYMPYGPVQDVIPYLIRRAQENTSVSGQMSRELKLLHQEIKRRKLPIL